jgi:hypothetical protein
MLLYTVDLYNVFYGDWSGTTLTYSNPTAVNIFTEFSTYIGSTPWYRVTSTYWDKSGMTPVDAVLNGTFFVNSTVYSKVLTFEDIPAMLVNQIAAGNIVVTPGVSSNVYNVILSEDVTATYADCSLSCGYHAYVDTQVAGKNTRIKYTVAANPASSKRCADGCTLYQGADAIANTPNGNYVADGDDVFITADG